MTQQEPILFRVFLGAARGNAQELFISARGYFESQYKGRVNFEIITTDDMKRDPHRYSPKELVDWLLAADIHLIVGHLHQGNDHLEWEITDLLNQYKRLRGHIGFPGGREDPVFLQNKIEYLLSLDEDDYLDTLCIAMPMVDSDGNAIMDPRDLIKLQS